MKLLCVGYPKTGSKSCSSALRKLGFNVADYMETAEILSPVWRDYVDGRATIDDVIDSYDKHGFDTNQDIPGNYLWEDLYRALIKRNDTQVILTVRDSDAAWWKSWCGFMLQECSRGAIGDLCLQGVIGRLAGAGYMGPETEAMTRVVESVITTHLDNDIGKGYGLSVKETMVRITKNEKKLRQGYLKHNLYVQSIVPKENLLVWNLKDGWAPLCAFLDKPIPNESIPHDNPTGDTKFVEKLMFESDFAKVRLHN